MPVMRRLTPLISACLALALAGPASADVREIGVFSDAPFPAASCPDDCQAIAQVSGYQTQIGKHKTPFKMKRAGKLVALTVRLGQPNADQLKFFRDTYGGTSSVRLSVLRAAKTKQRHRLLRQSDVFQLDAFFGSTPTFAFDKAIPVIKGDIVALTVPSWAPAFAHGLANDNTWRSSHHDNECTQPSPPPAAQQTDGSLRIYGCFYRTARLLYSAHYVPDPKPTTPPAK